MMASRADLAPGAAVATTGGRMRAECLSRCGMERVVASVVRVTGCSLRRRTLVRETAERHGRQADTPQQ